MPYVVWFCLICNKTMHILPLPLCGLHSIRAQNGYGPHRPCKIVLLTLVAPRRVTDLHLSWGINIEHARTAYHKTCGTEYQQPYRRCNSQTPYFKWNIAQARPMSVSDVSRSLQVEFQSPIGRTHSWRFSIFIKMKYEIPKRSLHLRTLSYSPSVHIRSPESGTWYATVRVLWNVPKTVLDRSGESIPPILSR